MPTHPNASSAEHVTTLLDAYHAGTLPQEQVAQIERHLAECRACRERSDELAVYQIIWSTPAPTVGPELRERVYGAIATESASHVATPATRHAPLRGLSRERPALFTSASNVQSRMPNRWVSGAVALIVVSLIAGLLIAAPRAGRHGQPRQVNQQNNAAVACRASAIKVDMPQHAIVGSMVMTSPTDGWAAGSVMTQDVTTSKSLIWKVSQCHWTPISLDLTGIALGPISMDSASDGWVWGMNASDGIILLHYSNGIWNRSPTPTELALGQDYPGSLQAFGPGDVWISAYTHKTSTGQMSPMALLHLYNGTWTSVTSPVPMISSLAPVGPNDLWLAGVTNDSHPTFEFAHYHAGKWNVMDAPTVGEDTLHAVSPTDIWASASMQAAFAHYDGVAWRDASQGLPPVTGSRVESYVSGDGARWIVQSIQQQQVNGFGASPITISNVWREVGGQWQDLQWPYHDLYIVHSWASVSDGEFWAIGGYMVEVPDPTQTNSSGYSGMGYTQTVVLHYADGVWTRYG